MTIDKIVGIKTKSDKDTIKLIVGIFVLCSKSCYVRMVQYS